MQVSVRPVLTKLRVSNKNIQLFHFQRSRTQGNDTDAAATTITTQIQKGSKRSERREEYVKHKTIKMPRSSPKALINFHIIKLNLCLNFAY